MSEIIESLSQIVGQYDAIFCDVWGVLHNGKAAFPPAVEALMQARLQGVDVSLVTNSPKTPAWVDKQLARMEVPESAYDRVITAGLAMQYSFFGSKYKKFYFIGSKDDEVIYTDLPEGVHNKMERTDDYKAADVILCAGPEYGRRDALEDYELELRQLFTRKLEMYCGNPDVVVDHGDQRIWCGGAIAEIYAKLGGTVYQFGKPYPPIYQLARERYQSEKGKSISPSNILFIGDGIDTDLKGAMLEDMDALFVTAGLAAEETGYDGNLPNPAKLAAFLNAKQSNPSYSMGALRW